MSEIIKQSSLIPEQGRGQMLPFVAQLRHEFGEWWIAVLQLVLEIGKRRKNKPASFLPAQLFSFLLRRNCMRWRPLTRREVRK